MHRLHASCLRSHNPSFPACMQHLKFPPTSTVYDSKRLLGSTFSDIEGMLNDWPFKVVKADGGNPKFQGAHAVCMWRCHPIYIHVFQRRDLCVCLWQLLSCNEVHVSSEYAYLIKFCDTGVCRTSECRY